MLGIVPEEKEEENGEKYTWRSKGRQENSQVWWNTKFTDSRSSRNFKQENIMNTKPVHIIGKLHTNKNEEKICKQIRKIKVILHMKKQYKR